MTVDDDVAEELVEGSAQGGGKSSSFYFHK